VTATATAIATATVASKTTAAVPTVRATKAAILCVDDEQAVLDGLELGLGRRYKLATATSGAEALDKLAKDRSITVVVSDMRMPNMDGATFLTRSRELAPDAARVLLTGQADMGAAIRAVNDGQIFRFLTKPCAPAALQQAIDAGIEHHRLITAERVLLEQTLHGSIKALTDVLAIVQPIAFGRAARIKKLAADIAGALAIPERWQVEVAAMLCQLGTIALPSEVVDKVQHGTPLDDVERSMYAKAPAVVDQILECIPRLETVRAIVNAATRYGEDQVPANIARAAAILRAAIEFDALDTRGIAYAFAIETLRATSVLPVDVLDALASVRCRGQDVRELRPAQLRPGMVLADDLRLASGVMLVVRGCEVTAGLLARLDNYPDGALPPSVLVICKPTETR
jgi:CheY-like chemotaxis protein